MVTVHLDADLSQSQAGLARLCADLPIKANLFLFRVSPYSTGFQTSAAPADPERNISGIVVAVACSVTLDVALGRLLACCVHPAASWRRLPPAGRALVVGAYFVAGYATGLLALLVT
jgi:hypothetical protein